LYVLGVIAAGLMGYLFGSIPVGIIAGRMHGVDVRKYGSGRTGGTNVYRAAGVRAGVLTALGDALKGVVAILLVRALGGTSLPMVVAGLGAIAGHNWSIFLGFRGGAGTMTNLGATLALSPPTFILAVPIGIFALFLSRTASIASLAVTIVVLIGGALFVLIGWESPALLIYGTGMTAMIVFSLMPNIQRILQGTERRIGGSQ